MIVKRRVLIWLVSDWVILILRIVIGKLGLRSWMVQEVMRTLCRWLLWVLLSFVCAGIRLMLLRGIVGIWGIGLVGIRKERQIFLNAFSLWWWVLLIVMETTFRVIVTWCIIFRVSITIRLIKVLLSIARLCIYSSWVANWLWVETALSSLIYSGCWWHRFPMLMFSRCILRWCLSDLALTLIQWDTQRTFGFLMLRLGVINELLICIVWGCWPVIGRRRLLGFVCRCLGLSQFEIILLEEAIHPVLGQSVVVYLAFGIGISLL